MELGFIIAINSIAVIIILFILNKRTTNSTSESQANTETQQHEILKLTQENAVLHTQHDAKQTKIDEQQLLLTENKSTIAQQTLQIQNLREHYATASQQLINSNEKIQELLKQIEALKLSEDQLEERLQRQFKIISHSIIEESREKVNQFNVNRMQEIMQPFEKNLKEFKEQMSSSQKEQTKERTELELKIKQMVEISQGMSTEAKNLSNALRGNNKTAGNWGETILENILQNSGLTVGKEGYELQSMLKDTDGNAYRNEIGNKMIPDAIVHFPDNRNVIIDSKVSISAYTDYCNTDDDKEKKNHLEKHLTSIKTHIKGLNIKSYENYVDGSLDFVMMFIPNDFAAMVALQSDLNLWQDAYNKKILIISPTNLITSLKIVSDLWSRERQHQNIEKILERGRFLYDKCCMFAGSFKKMGDTLDSTMSAYNAASTQLGAESGIIRQAEMLVEFGIKSKKQLPLKSKENKQEIENT